jgi:tRNA (guanine-N7-)-methyltransferase
LTLRPSRRLPFEELIPYLLAVPAEPAVLDWQAVFGNAGPVEIEIGFGKGLFLVTAARACPEVNFLGIEIARKYQLFTATRMAKRGLRNVRLAQADARHFLAGRVASSSCQAIHVYFPDPWWKKRHLKRRLFTAEFVSQCERVLQRAGCLHLVTDVEDYFRAITETVAPQSRLQPLPPSDAPDPAHDLDYLTNFERKFRKEGRPIYRMVYEKLEP